ncbi:unnamed protein product [Coffea canephora]|uniref:Uncharacterized protein n=1 Tax=Coffea canephora TaxID=49390 RepID=A0A068UMH6_COFCA|nr:unnamed protein product [Coffea canephora]
MIEEEFPKNSENKASQSYKKTPILCNLIMRMILMISTSKVMNLETRMMKIKMKNGLDSSLEHVVLFRLIFIKHFNMNLLPYLDCYLLRIKHVWDFYFINFVNLDEFGELFDELNINLDDWILWLYFVNLICRCIYIYIYMYI